MRVQSISNVLSQRNAVMQKKSARQQNFKGLVAPIERYQEKYEESLYGGEYDVTRYTDVEKVKYYQFLDDSPKELKALKAKYEYYKKVNESEGNVSAICHDKQGEVEVIKVPLSYDRYKEYIANQLSSQEKDCVENALKTNDKCNDLLKKKEFTYKDALSQAIQEERARRIAALNEAATKILEAHKNKEVKLSDASELLK